MYVRKKSSSRSRSKKDIKQQHKKWKSQKATAGNTTAAKVTAATTTAVAAKNYIKLQHKGRGSKNSKKPNGKY